MTEKTTEGTVHSCPFTQADLNSLQPNGYQGGYQGGFQGPQGMPMYGGCQMPAYQPDTQWVMVPMGNFTNHWRYARPVGSYDYSDKSERLDRIDSILESQKIINELLTQREEQSTGYGNRLLSEEPLYMQLLRERRVRLKGDVDKDMQRIFKASYKHLRRSNKDFKRKTKWRSPVKGEMRALLRGMTHAEYFSQRSLSYDEFYNMRTRIETAAFRDPNYVIDPLKKNSIARRALAPIGPMAKAATALA